MSHSHTLIRDAAVTALTGLATTGSRVYANRMHSMDTASLPGLRIFLDSETVGPTTIHGPTTQERSLVLLVECCAASTSGMDDTCDQMQLEVEEALAAGITVDGEVREVMLTGSRYDFEAGSPPVGVKRITFNLDFYTLANAPDSLL